MSARSKSGPRSPYRRPLNMTYRRPLNTTFRRLLNMPYRRPLDMTIAYCLLVLLAGCPGPKPVPNGAAADGPLAGVKLRLAVVDDPPLAAAAERLRGEWNSLTGAEFDVESIAQGDLDAAKTLEHDAVVCPAHKLGPLVERKLIAPMPEELRQDDAGDWSDLFELLQLREAAWGSDVYGVPFGSPVLTCYYRADLLEKLGRKPPESWAEYRQFAELLADQAPSGDGTGADGAVPWSATMEPLGPGWAGLVLLARAAPYAKHRANYSTLFDIETMEPLVAGPPFVRALEELVAVARLGSADQLKSDPTAIRAAFWQGRCGMALSWPTAAGSVPVGEGIPVGFAELPGSTRVYNVGKQRWETRAEEEDPHVPLLSVAGRIGVVRQKSAHRQAAFRLLLWLSGKQFSPQVCASSPATTLFRRGHVASPQKWVEGPVSPAAAKEYGSVTEAALQREQWLAAPEIPGRSEYLSALDEAVHRAVRGEQSASEALGQAAVRWRRITQRLGKDRQRTAYRHSLGLE